MYRPKRGYIEKAINNGITSLGFYIVTEPEHIPNCPEGRTAKLERIHQFARENGWHVTIHNGNGWILFTGSQVPEEEDIENDLGQLAELIQQSLN